MSNQADTVYEQGAVRRTALRSSIAGWGEAFFLLNVHILNY